MRAKWIVCLAIAVVPVVDVRAEEGAAGGGFRVIPTLGGPGAHLRSSAYGINNNGQVVGEAWAEIDSQTYRRAFVWDLANGIRSLGSLGGTGADMARGINNCGQVVGTAHAVVSGRPDSWSRAFLWDEAIGMQNLGTLDDEMPTVVSHAYDINDHGQVVGNSRLRAPGPYDEEHAFLWDANNGMQDLNALFPGPNSYAMAINNQGEIAGKFWPGEGSSHAFVWSPTSGLRDLHPSTQGRYSLALDINDHGETVGFYSPDGNINYACFWDETGSFVSLGPDTATAVGINNKGQVVGVGRTVGEDHRAFLWDDANGLRFLDDPPGWDIIEPTDINDNGWIVGYALGPADETRAFVIVPEPATLALLALGGLVVLKRRRR